MSAPLRGSHATLALEAGATSEMVAQALGHGSLQRQRVTMPPRRARIKARAARVAGGAWPWKIPFPVAGRAKPGGALELKKRLS